MSEDLTAVANDDLVERYAYAYYRYMTYESEHGTLWESRMENAKAEMQNRGMIDDDS
jgi:hypothetical protein